MKLIKTPSLIALAIYLILVGLNVVRIHTGDLSSIAALVAGILILIGK